MHKHFAGDGCNGLSRPLDDAAMDDIVESMATMLMGVNKRDTPRVLHAGAYIGMHYGPEGEWALALRLATQIGGLAPSGHCNDLGQPSLTKALPLTDPRILDVAHHLVAMFPESDGHTSADVNRALKLAAPQVESFVHAYQGNRKAECRAAWEAMYEFAEISSARDMDMALHGGACSALLICWAAHYSVQRISI